ncbi:MAG: sigma-70 family RNA polymerase sigma factor [Bryobacteraceae bacterium]
MSANQQPPPGPGPLWTTLVERVAGGDPSALQTLCASLAGLKGYFCKHVGPDDAEDMFHDLIIVLTRQIQEGALKEPERFLGYVRAIAQRRIAAQIRVRMQSRRTCSVDDVQLPDPAENTETSLARKELRAIARRVLKAMPVQQREMLIRFYLQEQRPEEIQEAFGITPTQFRLIKYRAKARFAHLCRTAMERKPMWDLGVCAIDSRMQETPMDHSREEMYALPSRERSRSDLRECKHICRQIC